MIYRLATLLLTLCALRVYALEHVETFTSRLNFASGTAVWNQALGKVHPTLRVMNYKAGYTPLNLSVGDGSHGSFDSTTYSRFGTVIGNVVAVDTTVFPILKVTRFELPAGYFLEPVGNNPLIIESLSTVNIQGEIWCHGRNGGNSVGATPGTGGTGRCGGLAGGDGGLPGFGGQNGTNATIAVTGGRGGNFIGGSYVGGGGGGAWSSTSPPGNGPNASGSGGQAGLFASDPEFLNVMGAGGGGGGSGAAAGIAGGGGGASGGVVVIRAVGDVNIGTRLLPTGFIYVNGGNGGNSDSTGGPGGGGAGGSVQVFSGGVINIFNNGGPAASQANAGTGGTNTVPDTGASGGLGRSWFSSVTYNSDPDGVGFYTPAEEAPVTPGDVQFSSASQYVISNTIDLANTLAQVNALTMSPTSADFVVEVAGSNDDFVSDDTGWTTIAASIAEKRYVKLKLSIVTTNVSAPTMIDTAGIRYTPGTLEDFKFKAAGCARIEYPRPPTADFNFLLLLIAPVIILILKLKTQRKLARR